MGAISARSLPGLPEVRPGDDIAAMIHRAAGPGAIAAGEIVAIAHTIVSKAEGALIPLAGVKPTERARELAAAGGKDPRLVQIVLDESTEILRSERGIVISRTRHGLVCANAGVDVSNAGTSETAIVLPRDPDASARQIRARLRELGDASSAPAVVVTDTFGRPWRLGQTDVAIGLAGLAPLDDWRGRLDADGTELRATLVALGDAVAGAAELARAKDSREPVVIVSGLERFVSDDDGPGARALIRPTAEDLFR